MDEGYKERHTAFKSSGDHEMNDHGIVNVSLLFLLSLILPLAIFLTKVFFKDRRAYAAKVLANEFPVLAQSYQFLFAVAKYIDGAESVSASLSQYSRLHTLRSALAEVPSYILPVLTYATICFSGFYVALMITVIVPKSSDYYFDNYLIYGMRAAAEITPLSTVKQPDAVAGVQPSGSAGTGTSARNSDDRMEGNSAPQLPVGGRYTDKEVEQYGKGTIAVSVAAFIGAYLWTLIFLARRVTNFDLSPFSFLRAAIQIALACFVCVFLRHLYDSVSQLVWQTSSSQSMTPTTSSWLLVLAFLIGFYPALGLNYLQERFAFLRFKNRHASADLVSRELPLDMVDGIDSYIKFRLGEYEIEDIENLALANPIQLFIETPYPLRKIIDWVGQAQLLIEVEISKIPDLRNLNIRTSLDFLTFGETEDGKKILGGLLHPMQASDSDGSKIMSERLRTFGDKAHVKALREIIEIVRSPRGLPTSSRLSEVA
jgi:hypothetical protein